MKTQIHLGARTYASPSKIVHLEAKENYTLVHFTDNTKLLTAVTIGVLEGRLQPFSFFRINRSMIVNLNYLHRFKIIKNHSQSQKTKSLKKEIIISRRRVAAFEACVNA